MSEKQSFNTERLNDEVTTQHQTHTFDTKLDQKQNKSFIATSNNEPLALSNTSEFDDYIYESTITPSNFNLILTKI